MGLPPPGEIRVASDAAPTTAALSRSFGDALRLGDGVLAERVVERALEAAHAPEAIQSLVIQPAMVRIGELWASGHLSVADEHLATSISQRSLIVLFEVLRASRPSVASGELVMLAGPEGQHHVLGLRMIGDVLEGAGFSVHFLGGDVPARDLAEIAAKHQPEVVGLTVSISTDVRCLADGLCAIHEAAPEARIVLGGAAVPVGLRESVYPYITNSMEVVPRVEAALAGPPQGIPAVVELMRSDGPQAGWPRTSHLERDATAERLAAVADEAVEMARRQVRRLAPHRDLARLDSLTQLPNRRALEEELIARSSEPHEGGVALMIDVDSFAAINAEYGHRVGDQLLRDVAARITSSLPPGTLTARAGGDEFVALLAQTPLEVGEAAADRILSAVAEVAPAVTVSVGVVEMTPEPRRTLLAAGNALYQAKAGGRNQVVVAAPEEPKANP